MPSNGYRRYSAEKQRKQRTKRWIIEGVVCVVLLTAAIIGSHYASKSILTKVMENVELRPDSDGFKNWLNPPIETVRNYYLFNISNPMDVVEKPSSTILQVKDTPPYAYNVVTNKKNVTWADNNTRIDYDVERIITRDPARFGRSAVDDTGVFVDLIRAIFRTQFQEQKPASSFYDIGGKDAFPSGKPVELLEGFTSSLFEAVREKMIGPNTAMSGFVFRQNGSSLYRVSIQSDLAAKGQVNTFSSELVSFNISSASHYRFPIYDSLTYPPMLFDKPTLNIFHADFCRPVLLQFVRTVHTLIIGIPVHEYRVKFIDLDQCTNPADTTTCTEVDQLDVSECISSSLPSNTVFLSKAHFYGSTEANITNLQIQGFRPSREKHDSVVYFEPYSGSPVKASFRMQLNVKATIDPMKQAEAGSGLEPATKRKSASRLVPIFWIDQDINLSSSVLNTLRMAAFMMYYGKWVLPCAVLVFCVLIVGLIELWARRSNAQTRRGYVKADTLVYH